MRRLSAHWVTITRQIASAKSLLVFLDYDGTVVPIVAHPSLAVLPVTMKRLLNDLNHQSGVSVALISGRALKDLKRMVGVSRLCYVGNHGLELEGKGVRYVHPQAQAYRPFLRRIARALTAALRPVPGAWVEDKGLTVSLHWRAVSPSFHRRFQRIVAQCTLRERQRRQVRLTRGKRVLEIRPPVQWGKGEVVEWLSRRLCPASIRARPTMVYVGDDQTDEDAFRVVNQCHGISVFVGQRPRATQARWWVRNPHEVHETLRRILQIRCQSCRSL